MKQDFKDLFIFLDELPIYKLIPIIIMSGITLGVLAGFCHDLIRYLFGGLFE